MNIFALSPIQTRCIGRCSSYNTFASSKTVENNTEICSKEAADSLKALYFTGNINNNSLLNEAKYLRGKSISVLADAEEIKQTAKKEKSREENILKYADGMYINACNLYKDAYSRIKQTQNGNTVIKRNDGKTNVITSYGGKVRQILMGFDGQKSEHVFLYSKNNISYYKNARFKEGKLSRADEEYLYQKGDIVKYDKDTRYDDLGCCSSDETRLFKNRQTSCISFDNEKDKKQESSYERFYFSDGELSSFSNEVIEAPNKTTVKNRYLYVDGKLFSFVENDKWENDKNSSVLRMEFKDNDIEKAFINNTMSMTSYFTSSKQYLYSNDKPKSCRLNFERTSFGNEFYADEIIF